MPSLLNNEGIFFDKHVKLHTIPKTYIRLLGTVNIFYLAAFNFFKANFEESKKVGLITICI